MRLADRLGIRPEEVSPYFPLSRRVRDGVMKCYFYHDLKKEEALALHRNNELIHSADLVLWTDGSYDNTLHQAGSAAYLVNENDYFLAKKQVMFEHAYSSYDAELIALLIGLRLIRDRGPQEQEIHVYTDSQSILTHLHGIAHRNSWEENYIRECAHLLARLTETNRVHLHWIPGHKGIGLNDHVDALAKDALRTGIRIEHKPTLTAVKNQLKKFMAWQSRKKTNRQIKQSSHRDYPDRMRFKKLKSCELATGPIFRMRTGHTRTLNHFKRLGIVEDDQCRLCDEAPETALHQLFHCTALAEPLERLRATASEQEYEDLLWNSTDRLERYVVKALRAGAHL